MGLGPSMTPMVDVVLVILIFFMASAALLGPEWLLRTALADRETPGESADPFAIPAPVFVVRVSTDEAGRARIDGLGLAGATVEQLGLRLRALAGEVAPETPRLIIEPDDEARYESVVRVRDACAGVGSVALR